MKRILVAEDNDSNYLLMTLFSRATMISFVPLMDKTQLTKHLLSIPT